MDLHLVRVLLKVVKGKQIQVIISRGVLAEPLIVVLVALFKYEISLYYWFVSRLPLTLSLFILSSWSPSLHPIT